MNSSTDEQTNKETRTFVWKLWQHEYIEFLIGGTKIRETKCPSINITKRNYWSLRIGVMRRFQKLPTYDFQSQFSMSKSFESFSIVFSLKDNNLGEHFCFWTFFHNINLEITLLLKWCPIFAWFNSQCIQFL